MCRFSISLFIIFLLQRIKIVDKQTHSHIIKLLVSNLFYFLCCVTVCLNVGILFCIFTEFCKQCICWAKNGHMFRSLAGLLTKRKSNRCAFVSAFLYLSVFVCLKLEQENNMQFWAITNCQFHSKIANLRERNSICFEVKF